MNFERDVIGRWDPTRVAMVEIDRQGERRAWTFAETRGRAASLAGALARAGVGKGDVVLTLIGNRPEWAFTMLATMRIAAVVLPCSEQLRAQDLSMRLGDVSVAAIVADPRNREQLLAADPSCPILWIDDRSVWDAPAVAHVEMTAQDPVLMTYTSGTSGRPKCVVHAHRYLTGQWLQTRYWLGLREDDVVWSTAPSGWSKSARNAFLAPWLVGAIAVMFDGRFDPIERMSILARESVTVVCMSPTEYRMIVNRGDARPVPGLRTAVAAGEALGADVQRAWTEASGVVIRDGYGQTETGQITATPIGEVPRPGSMGRPLPGVKTWVEGGELLVEPATVPTFFLGYRGSAPPVGPWHTGDLVTADEDGYLYFEGRADDVIISSGYRIGPVEVESALQQHAAVNDVAVIAHPHPDRGSIVRAVVVLRDGWEAGPKTVRMLQEHVKTVTAPYKYPRRIDFVDTLPRTASGKVRRAELRVGGAQ